MIPNFSPPLSHSRFNDEPANHGRLSELSSSRLPSLSSLLRDDHEHERNNRRLLSDHGVSFSPSRLRSSSSSSSRLFNEREASFLSSLLPSSFSHDEREPADRGASLSSSRLPSLSSLFSDDHEHERNNRGLLSDHGASFSFSRLPSSSSHLLNEREASFLFSLPPSILPSSFSRHEREPTDRGASFSSSRLPSLSSLFSDDHEHERNNRGLLSDHGASFSSSRLPSSSSHLLNEREASFLFSSLPSILPSSFSRHEREPTDRGASFSSSRLPSSFSRFSDDVSSDDNEHALPSLFDHDHVPSRFSDDHEHVSSDDDDEHARPSLFDHEHVPSRSHELSLSSDDDEHVPSRFSNDHDHEHVPSQFSDDHEHEPTYHGSVSPNFSLFDSKEDASTSAIDNLVKNGSFVVGSNQQKQGFDVGFYCSICLEEPQAGDKLIRMNCSHIYHQYCLLPWLQMHNSCPNCRSKLDQQ